MSAKICITEDEALIADHLAMCLEDLGYVVASIADNAAESIGNITIHKPDLVLIDIQIRGEIDGIQLAKIIRKQFNIPFIYITSNGDSATIERLKETQPAGFILKPFSPESLRPIIEIALHNSQESKNHSEVIEVDDAFFIKEGHTLIKVHFNDILYAEAQSNYTLIKTKNQKYLMSQTLKVLEEKLDSYGFMRVHRSYVVNLKKINQILPKSVMIEETEIPLSDANRGELLDKIRMI